MEAREIAVQEIPGAFTYSSSSFADLLTLRSRFALRPASARRLRHSQSLIVEPELRGLERDIDHGSVAAASHDDAEISAREPNLELLAGAVSGRPYLHEAETREEGELVADECEELAQRWSTIRLSHAWKSFRLTSWRITCALAVPLYDALMASG
jgi:hypothetical protein